MKIKYYSVVLCILLLVQSDSEAKVIFNKKIFYSEIEGQINLKFGYAFNKDTFKNNPQDKISSYSNLKILYLQSVHPSTQIGFSFKIGTSDLTNLKQLDIKKIKTEEGYFIIKKQGFGSIEYGKRDLVSQSMLINTLKIYTAAGGVNGEWANYANLRGGDNSTEICQSISNARPKKCDGAGYNKDDAFWVKPNIYSSYVGLESKLNHPVVSYISPEIYNFQFGFSYILGGNNLHYRDLIGAGLSYKYSLSEDINFTAALTGELAGKNFTDEENCLMNFYCNNSLKHWNFGVNVKYFNFNYIFSYGDGGKSGRMYNDTFSGIKKSAVTYYINTGIAYHSDSRKLSLTYFHSERDIANIGTKELSSYALSIEYPFIIGTSYYFDIVKFDTREPKVENNNSGYVLLAGLKLNF